jgi:Fe-S cluster biogenesis protein NfuA
MERRQWPSSSSRSTFHTIGPVADTPTSEIETTAVADTPEAVDLEALNAAIEYIRPALQADGGDLVLLGVEGGRVSVRLIGACVGCPLASFTLGAGIERVLRDRVPGITEVVAD